MTATTDLVLRLLVELAPEIDPAGVDLDRELRDQVDLDSMDFLNLMEAVAAQTGVEVPERDYPKVASIAALAAYTDARRG
ncbi:MAG: acyl carrier protein [Acidimicrobiales bacterium]|nr:acyl carrier protein [Acidimicrobiales bacterium]